MKNPVLFAAFLLLLSPSFAFAYDFGTAATLAAIGTVAIGTAIVFGTWPALGTLAIATAISGLTFDTGGSGGNQLAVQIAPGAPMATPPGWPDANTPPSSATQTPSSSTSCYYYGVHPAGGSCASSGGDTKAGACAARGGTFMLYSGERCSMTASQCAASGFTSGCYDGVLISYGMATETVPAQCPAGYSVSGSTCVLSAPEQVQKPADSACGIKRTGNTFTYDGQDPDCASVSPNITVTPNTVTEHRPDGTTRTIQLNSDGTSRVVDSVPNNSTGTTQSNITYLSAPDAAGGVAVTGQASTSTNGTGTANDPNATAQSVDLGPDPGIGSPGISGEENGSGTSLVGTVMNSLPGFSSYSLPSYSAQCEAPQFDFFGTHYTMQSMCDLLEGQRSLLSSLFLALWGIFAFSLVMRA